MFGLSTRVTLQHGVLIECSYMFAMPLNDEHGQPLASILNKRTSIHTRRKFGKRSLRQCCLGRVAGLVPTASVGPHKLPFRNETIICHENY